MEMNKNAHEIYLGMVMNIQEPKHSTPDVACGHWEQVWHDTSWRYADRIGTAKMLYLTMIAKQAIVLITWRPLQIFEENNLHKPDKANWIS